MKNYILKNWLLLSVAFLFMCISIVNWNNQNEEKKYTPKYTTVSSKKDALKVIYVHDTIVKKFHEIKSITKVEQKIKIDTVKIVFKDSVPCIFERSGELKKEYYTLGYKLDNKSLEITKLDIVTDTLKIVDGSKRKWFWGKETNAVDVSHTNKLFYNSDVQYVEVKKEKKFYDTTLFKFGVGFATGIAITRQ